MSKRIFIVCEGQTEEKFIKELVQPWFAQLGIWDVRPIKIATSKAQKGGFVNYQHLKNDVVRLLKSEKNALVSTFVDYFRIPKNMPNYANCHESATQTDSVIACLELAMEQDIGHPLFVPYIQRHEFEALLFASNRGFEKYYEESEHAKTEAISAAYPNPEDINSSPEKSPSHRIKAIIRDYDKVVDGNVIALEIGLDTIREHCPRFRSWLDKLVALSQSSH